MKEYINEMLHLTADIAEELLRLKDTDNDVDEELCRKIRRLSFIADHNVGENADDRIEEITKAIIQDRANELREEAETGVSDAMASDALIDEARREAELSETDDIPNNEVTDDHQCEPSSSFPHQPLQEENNDVDADNADNDGEPTVEEAESEAWETNEAESPTPQEDMHNNAESAEFEEADDAGDRDNTAPTAIPVLTASQLRNSLTLNDMFLYSRTLFGGSSDRFDKALAHIATLQSISDVKAFLSETGHINLNTEEAKDFISSISQFFNE